MIRDAVIEKEQCRPQRRRRKRQRYSLLRLFNYLGLTTYTLVFVLRFVGERVPLDLATVLCALLFLGHVHLYYVLKH